MTETTTHQIDTVIIGAGPGGYVAAIRCAQLGKESGRTTMLIEKEAMGGVCLNWGCIPSKAMIYAAGLLDTLENKASTMGILVDNPRVDMGTLQSWKNDVVKKLTGGIGQLCKANGVERIKGTASFKDTNTLEVQTATGFTETVVFKNAIIATGSSSIQIPGFEFNDTTIIDSRVALDLEEVPESMAVIGGGVIGLELGMMYAKLGTEITVIEMADQVLPGTDKDIVQVLSRSMKKKKIKVHTGAKAKSCNSKKKSASITFETKKGDDETLDVEKILVAVGRKPNSKGIGLENAGIATNDRGFITVDDQCRTSVPNIFAIGDVTSGPLLAHRASKEGTVVAGIINGSNEILDYRALPGAVFCDPEIATVGLTEAEAMEQGHTIKVGKFPFQASGRALTMGKPDGMVKLISDADTDVVLGVHMIGPDVAEFISEATLAIEMGATAEDIALTVHTHPTLPESLMEAAEAVHGLAIHIYQKEKPEPVGSK